MKTLLIKISLVIILYSSLITITPLLSQNIDSLFELSEKQHDLTKLKTLSEILHIVNPETHVNYLKNLQTIKILLIRRITIVLNWFITIKSIVTISYNSDLTLAKYILTTMNLLLCDRTI